MKRRRFTVHHLIPGLSLVFTVFLFAPVDLFFSSADEFWFSLGDLALWLLLIGLSVFALVTVAAVFLPPKLSVAFRATVYACSFLAWLQGNALVLDYGTLDGRSIDWSAYTLQYALDACLWIAVIIIFVFLMFRLRKRFRTVLEVMASILLITQVLSLALFFVRYNNREDKLENRYLSSAREFTVSAEDNTIVFVLDTFDSHLFENLRQKYPELIGNIFENFSYYPDTVGGATRTKYAIPFILTGTVNREEQSYTTYLSRAFEASPLIRELSSGRYDTGFYTNSHYLDLSLDTAIGNIVSGNPRPSSRFQLTKAFLKLTAFRYAPSCFSRFFWIYTGDFELYKNTGGLEPSYRIDDKGFYNWLIADGLSVSTSKPCFRFYHLNGVHEPYVLDQDTVAWEKTDEVQQALGTLNIVSEYLSRLKDAKLYDRTAVIILADHGSSRYSNAEQTPLFMVKYPGASHAFEVLDIPFSYASLPELLTSAVTSSLTSLEPYRASSPRYFYRKIEDQNNVTNITEYAVNGPALDTSAVKTGVVYHEDTLRRTQNYTLGTPLYFDERDTARGYFLSGLSGNEGTFTWTDANDAEMLFILPAVPEKQLRLDLVHGTYTDNQTVEVWINDRLIDTYTASGQTKHSVIIPAGTLSDTELRLRLHLPDACSPASLGHSSDSRLLALSMQSLVIREYP